MSKIITVVGATGSQGGSVIRTLLGNKSYKLRAITRNPASDAAKALIAQGVEVVKADASDVESLKTAFHGSYAVFAVTNFFDAWPAKLDIDPAIELEVKYGVNMAKAAAATESLQHYIWSTLPNSRVISKGKITVPHHEGKNQIDDFIKSEPKLLSKTTFLWVAFYAENANYPWYTPVEIAGSDPNILYTFWSVPTSIPVTLAGEVSTNVGLFVEATLAHPDKTTSGRAVLVATDKMTAGELTALRAESLGKRGAAIQIEKKAYSEMWPKWGDEMDLMHSFWDLVQEDSFSGETVVTGKDLGVEEGLVDTRAAFAKMQANA